MFLKSLSKLKHWNITKKVRGLRLPDTFESLFFAKKNFWGQIKHF